MTPHPIIRRTSDGALFEPSVPETSSFDPALWNSISGGYYFRRVEWKRAGWIPWKRWVRTGEVWTPPDDQGWGVVT